MPPKSSRFSFIFLFALSAALLVPSVPPCARAAETEDAGTDPSPKDLDHYLALPDDSFAWKVVENAEGSDSFLLEMTSQTWHGIPWTHFLLVSFPSKTLTPDHAILYIDGKRIGRKPGEGDRLLGRSLAEAAGMVIVQLYQVPNQPLLGNYVEDALIGETLLKALETRDTTWPLLFPMAKSAIRAMDAVGQFAKNERDLDLRRFVVTGASKRGWTTWLAGASKDPRVVAIAPIVIDTLNIRHQMDYQVESWGDFSPSIHDYTDRKLVRKDGGEPTDFERRLWEMVDPFSYRSRLTMPKLLVHGTNDPFWTVDATRFYWDELRGTKFILTLPNAGHGLEGQHLKAAQTLAVFARHAASGDPWPEFRWTLEEKPRTEGTPHDVYRLTFETDLPFSRARLWTATSETKDFRKAKWSARTLEIKSGDPVDIPKPPTGHLAFFVELEARAHDLPFSLTTQVWRF